ncbi:His Kinase A (phospho-acceptor) domain-containing protein [Chryseolinea serpens]|uniref:histidine kinase n=1 Tax=Chryseolinea serpens TaxID=947013 RepID=A0A1M5MP50_9BACT|nr:ATP-binding protein [Chryseolinea serpens]SHG78533.1 His Kinase A (phospho-acceptor) domain-containing protein [Chryseolinea serpens]
MLNNISKFKILVVDDRDENLLALETILQNENYTLVKANSGKEALSILLNDVDFHLILLDVVMPVMNGFETAELIYSREKLVNIPIIFLTAMDIEGNIYKGYQAGAIDYISKPIIPDLLKVKVKAFVELSEKTRELVRQEKELRIANEKLESLNEVLQRRLEQVESLDSFNYSVSHDLVNPLTSIIALTNLLKDMPIDDEALKLVNLIMTSSDRMTKLIRDLLHFSRQAREEISSTEFSMRDLVNEVVQDIALSIPLDKTEVIIHDMPTVEGDNNMLKQVWTNLISNAIKYSQKKENPRVEIGARQEQGKFVYFIRDNGAGFDMKNYNKLFEIFQRLHSEKDFNGTGIGLAIVKRIVNKHNGKIWAESNPGNGSNFYFTLNA